MSHFSIRNKITVVISAVLAMTLLVMAYFTLSFFEARYKDSITAQEFTLVSAMGNEIDAKMENAHKLLIANAELLPVADVGDPEKMQAFLDSRVALLSLFDSHLFVFSPEGKIIAESPFEADRRGLDISFRDYIPATVATHHPYISEPYVSTQIDRQPAIMFTTPIFDENQRLVAIFAGSLNLLKENFIGTLAATKIGQEGYVYLYNRDRTIIIHPQRDRILQKDVPLGSNHLFDKATQGFQGSGETVNSRGLEILASFKQLRTKDWILAANHPLGELYAPITEARTYFLLISLLVLAVVLFMIRATLKVLTNPLIKFTQHVQEIPQKIGSDRLSTVKTNDEIGALSDAFNQMILELDGQKQALTHSEIKYRGVFEAAQDAIFIETLEGKIIDANPSACKALQYSREELVGMSISRLLPDDEGMTLPERIQQVLAAQTNPSIAENLRKDGSKVLFELTAREYRIADRSYVVLIARDVGERKQMEEKLRYLSQRDSLTGLYDRAFFEEENLRLSDNRFAPVGMVICDIDGLKLVNDTLGHSAGDTLINKAASLIKSCFRETDIIARIGGDEFAILLPNCSPQAVENACQRINDSVFEYNLLHSALPLSISVGYAIGSEQDVSNLGELFREADDNMYREKLLNSQTARHSLFQSILREADAKDFRAGGHSDRVKDLSDNLANRLQLPKSRIATLRRLAQHHDIGKVCISDRILFKPGSLTPEERVKMQRHSDIGRRIAQSIPDLTGIADLIWKHHEWWDGSGYPLGLKQDEIPLECRILSIAEAYEAMTHDQPYRSALSEQAAKAELARCAGSQFDPTLVSEFLAMLDDTPSTNEDQVNRQAN
ncbi:hypothetical protein AXX12_09315 [Anaerosporomusa subterranea]|uniref:Diguanylate cyclase n=1 Tax=Anaerosporomusa subterranea TaxID=1794912 RepID=A0A154BRU6_ANASB|nr:HD domain-containing phosphohydrolase [Anaerosporomusa subterranea]KYZ76617.1 hypothetical protein AXX12_09315 [Anaerosporomusa subterranea]